MALDFANSRDLCELRRKILKLDKELRDDNEEKEESIAVKEKLQHLNKRAEEADQHIFSLTAKIRNLVDNYAAFSSILESKKELSNQVSELKKKNAELTEKYNEDIERLRNEIQETKDAWTAVLADTHEEQRKNISSLENSWTEKLLAEESKSRSLQEKLEEENKNHANNLEMLKKQHHEELENLRIQFDVLQKSFASSSCGMDIYAQKFQQAKIELEKKLDEKDMKISELTRRLKETDDEMRHLKLLSVVRNAQKAPLPSTSTENVVSSNMDSTPGRAKEVARHVDRNNGNISVASSNTPATKFQLKEEQKKTPKRRKLYSKVNFLSPVEIEY